MQNSKLQCPTKSSKQNIMQTRLIAKCQPYTHESKEKSKFCLRKTGLKRSIHKKLMTNKENQTNRPTELVSFNPLEPQNNVLCKVSSNKDKQNLLSTKFNQFGNQQFTGAIRKIVISKKSALKRSKRVETTKEFSEIVPQPSAFVHILSAFISSSFETNFSYNRSLAAMKTLSRVLEDVPEENETIYESSFTKPAITLSLNKSIATYVSPIEFSSNKSSSTTAYEMVCDKEITEFFNEKDTIEKPSQNCFTSTDPEGTGHEIIPICGNIRNNTKTESINGNEKATQDSITEGSKSATKNASLNEKDCQCKPTETLNDDSKENEIKNSIQKLRCIKIESIFKSNCIDEPSKEICSISCPCIRELDEYYRPINYYCLVTCNDEDQNELEIRASDDSECVCACEDCKGNEKYSCVRYSQFQCDNKTVKIVNEEYGKDKNEIDRILRFSSSLPNQKIKEEHRKIDSNDMKNIITLYSKNQRNKVYSPRRGNNMNACTKEEDSFGDFRKEVLDFFGSSQNEVMSIEDKLYDEKNSEDLILPSVKLVIPKFSQILPDIGRTTREKINDFLAKSKPHHRHKTENHNLKKQMLLYIN